jgi:radical SAM protein with 4Fe4S-binding SPASM domain
MKKKDIYKILEDRFDKKFKVYRDRWNKSGQKKIKLNYPIHLNFELISGCNFKCEFCLHSLSSFRHNNKVRERKIPFNKYCEIIDEGVKNGLCSIELNGINEPLLQKDIYKYIDYAVDSGILMVSLHTNAALLTEEMSNSLVNSKLTLIVFSVDAFTSRTYEKIRKSRGYKKVFDNINRFIEIRNNKKFPLIRMSFCRNKVNYKEFDDFDKFWRDRVNDISTSYFCNPFVGMENYDEIENKFRMENFDLSYCTEPYQRLFISSTGDVYPCCSFFGREMKVGNIYNNSIHNIWNGDKMEEVKKLVNKEDSLVCNKCKSSMKGKYL